MTNTHTILNTVLASEHILYQTLRNYHWNVEGREFLELHEFFETLYTKELELVDEIAERMRALDLRPDSTFKLYIEKSLLVEEEQISLESRKMLENLVSSYSLLVEKYTSFLDDLDPVTEGFIAEIIEGHQKNLWMIKSLLK